MLSRLASSALILSVLAIAACDLQPAPKDQGAGGGMVDPSTQPKAAGSAVPTPTTPVAVPVPTPTPVPVPTPTPTIVPDPAAGSAAGSAAAGSAAGSAAVVPDGAGSAVPMPVTDACVTTTSKIAAIMINAATDPTQKAALEQDRTKLIRRMAEACTRDAWTPATQKCFQDASTTDALQICSKNLSAP